MSKPPMMTYSELFARLGLRPPRAPVTVAAVWQRQLVLGPAPEFRLAADGELALPADCARWDVEAREILGFDG